VRLGVQSAVHHSALVEARCRRVVHWPRSGRSTAARSTAEL
jgi:hypothetical protein